MASSQASLAPMPIRIVMQDPGSHQTPREKHIQIAASRSHSAKFIGRQTRWNRQMSWRRQRNLGPSDHSTPSGKGSEDSEDREATPPTIQTSLTQNKRDPFSPYSAPQGPTIFQELVEYDLSLLYVGCPSCGTKLTMAFYAEAYDTIWPSIVKLPGNPAVHPGRREWRLAALENPAVYHVHRATVADFGKAIYHAQGLSDEFDKLRLFHHTEALRLVRQMIQAMDADSIPSDALVMAVYNLSYQGTGWDYRVVPESHPPSPFFKARLLGRFGRKAPQDDHVRALNTLIRVKGGLEEIRLVGIAEMIWLWNLDVSSARITSPAFPLLKQHATILTTYNKAIQASIRDDTFKAMGSGFLMLPENGAMGMLRDCLLCTAAITVDLEQMKLYQQDSPKFRELQRAALGVHHWLLTLPVDTEDSDAVERGEDRLLYRTSRLAALLYHNIVIFPHVESSGIKPLLAERLNQVLGEESPKISLGPGSRKYCGFMLWALLLGSIGATWTNHRCWFVDQLSYTTQQLGIERFEQFQAFMSKFLWFENMAEPALKVWMEIINNNIDSSYKGG